MPEEERPSALKLPPEISKQLKLEEANVVRARKDIATLKKLGLETKSLEDKLEWAEEARKTLLKEFG
ncbi:MAG: hypothetical protein ACW99U_17180 [Candidatus Thorarchaeota archaeon]|jgi:hypothetical protein